MAANRSATITLSAATADFDGFLGELTEALRRAGLSLDGERVTQDGLEVAHVTERQPERIVFEWHEASWQPDATSELELRREGERMVVELRGFGESFWDDRDRDGWFASNVVAPALAAAAPAALADWLIDRGARRPSGAAAREGYRAATQKRPSIGAVLEVLDPGPSDTLLEVGCGGGVFLDLALRGGCRVRAVDHSPEMVALAREVNADAVADGRAEIVLADAERLPFADGSCTCGAMMQVFFFLDAAAALAECRRVIRPGGTLAVFTVAPEARGTPAAPEPFASQGKFYADAGLVRLAREAGFDDARVLHPDLERHAREAELPPDVVELFAGASAASQLLVAR